MPELKRSVGVAVDLAGCPNRCRHCYLGTGPNKKLPKQVLYEAAEAFWSWKRPGEKIPFFQQVDVSSCYREPDFSDEYRELYEVERRLSRREPRRWELLSVWRLARDPAYAAWAREHGPKVCQITFFGGREVTDWFCRRRGAFTDNITATQRLLAAGMIPRWQIILTKRALGDLAGITAAAKEMRLAERAAELAGRFDVFCHLPGPDGEAFGLEDIRLEEADLMAIPRELFESTAAHSGEIAWRTEGEIVREALEGREIAAYEPEEQWFFVNAELDVFSNYGDLTAAWRLGNLRRDSLTEILASFESDAAPGLRASFHLATRELAGRFGRRESRRLYAPGDLKARWVRLATESAR